MSKVILNRLSLPRLTPCQMSLESAQESSDLTPRACNGRDRDRLSFVLMYVLQVCYYVELIYEPHAALAYYLSLYVFLFPTYASVTGASLSLRLDNHHYGVVNSWRVLL